MKPPKHKILQFPKTPGFRPFSRYFDQNSIQHPAKANLFMLHFLIENFTEPGDTILDPMAGTGSTGVVANLLGRNAILVDLEEKFCRWMRENVKLTKKNGAKGTSVVIQGDSRKLSQLLKENTDAIVTSPPYSESMTKRRKGYTVYSQLSKTRHMGLESSDQNIANLPHGSIDAVITSPPYSEAQEGGGIAKRGYQGSKHSPTDLVGKRSYMPDKFENPENISKLPFGNVDAIVTSPPHGDSEVGKGIRPNRWEKIKHLDGFKGRKEWKHGTPSHYSSNPNNIGNLPHGEISAVITSPPYSLTREGSDRVATGINVPTGKSLWSKTGSMFSCGNIQKLPHGDIDTIITSPPYAEQLQSRGGTQNKERMMKGNRPHPYSKNKENIGNLSYRDVDVVITSPPYARDKGGEKGMLIHDEKRRKDKTLYKTYGENPENIDNLPYGVDAVITSPPYEGGSMSVPGGKCKGYMGSAGGIATEMNLPKMSSGNISRETGETYLEAMLKVYRECWKVLKPKGKLILILKNFIRNKAIVRLDEDTIKLCQAAGFRLVDRFYRKLKQKSFWRILYAQKFPDVPTIDYESILIFKKV